MHRLVRAACAALIIAMLAAVTALAAPNHRPVGSSSAAKDRARATAVSVPSAQRPCAVRRTPPRPWQHVVWIVMENKSYDEALAPRSAPFLRGLAAQCAVATRYSAITHPSLPNYIAMTSGDTQGIADDGGPGENATGAQSIFSQLGDNWRLLAESMPGACNRGSLGSYAVKHNPAAYYDNLRASCARNDLPLGRRVDLSAAFTFVTPDLCHDTHDCGVASGDRWLRSFVPRLLATRQYRAGRTAIFITWDEDDGGAGNRVPLIAIAPSVRRGTRSRGAFDHYSLLRTTEEMLRLPGFLGHAASARSMRSALGV